MDEIGPGPIDFAWADQESYRARLRGDDASTVAAILHGAPAGAGAAWPQVRSRLRPLAGRPQVEVWRGRGPLSHGSEDGFRTTEGEDFLFAAATGDEPGTAGLAGLSEDLYGRLLRLTRNRGFPHLLRVWNVISGINEPQDGLERYRHFSIGRYKAFAREAPAYVDRYPAASAVGCPGRGLTLYALAGRDPGTPIENPNQVSAYRYPPLYGPRSPSFSRALVKPWRNGASLFLSGTASITGHETRHPHEPVAQTARLLDNFRTLIAEAERVSGRRFPLAQDGCALRVFVRHERDYPAIRAALEKALGSDLLYLQADICRHDLVVEIEGVIPAG